MTSESDLDQFLAAIVRPVPVYTCARLVDGRAVRLSKDCDCVTHEGPHWLYCNREDRIANTSAIQKLGRNVDYLSLLAFGHEERARLRGLRWNFERNKVVQLFTDEDALALQAGGESVGTECAAAA